MNEVWKKPPIPLAPFHVVMVRTLLRPASTGSTSQVVTMLEFASRSTSDPSTDSTTSTRHSRERFFVAASFQCARVPAPWPPDSTRYSLNRSVRICGLTFS